MASSDSLDKAIAEIAVKFNISDLNRVQKHAITKFVNGNKDMFINLPTGFGKSLIYQSLPLVFDSLSKSPGHIVAIVSPLVNLIADQVSYLTSIGISAISLTAIEHEADKLLVEGGKCSVVYGTPEAWLLNERWRAMLNNSAYSTKLCALAIDEAHVIKQWGTSKNQKQAVFRMCYSRLHEMRTLAPNVKLLALTATASEATRDVIFDVLNMQSPYVVYESPDRGNITYSVVYMPNDIDLEQYFGWLVKELVTKKEHCDRTIIYCQTIKQCGLLYAIMKGLLGKQLYVGSDSRSTLIEMLHSCTPESNKENILKSFSDENGYICLLIATIAFGMGMDCKGVKRVIHFGPSKNIESYAQETGRAGRDESQSIAFLLYNGMLLSHVEGDIKSYIKSDQCRRKTLLKHFQATVSTIFPSHLCCDICASKCECDLPGCQEICAFPAEGMKIQSYVPQRSRQVSPQQREMIHKELIVYHKQLATNLLCTSGNNPKLLTDISFVIGFSEIQIHQIMDNLQHLFDLQDICNFVEIWDKAHAHKILQLVGKVFEDIDSDNWSENVEQLEMDDMWFEDWDNIIQDGDLINLVADNLPIEMEHLDPVDPSLLQVDNSISESEQEDNDTDTSSDEIPDSICNIMQEVNLNDA